MHVGYLRNNEPAVCESCPAIEEADASIDRHWMLKEWVQLTEARLRARPNGRMLLKLYRRSRRADGLEWVLVGVVYRLVLEGVLDYDRLACGEAAECLLRLERHAENCNFAATLIGLMGFAPTTVQN